MKKWTPYTIVALLLISILVIGAYSLSTTNHGNVNVQGNFSFNGTIFDILKNNVTNESNKTLLSVNIDGNVTINGSDLRINDGFFYGNGSQLTDISFTVDDVWVNTSGDNMTGNLIIAGELHVNGSDLNVTTGIIRGNGSGLTNVPFDITDVWVNTSGDNMTGNLVIAGELHVNGSDLNVTTGIIRGNGSGLTNVPFDVTDDWLNQTGDNVTGILQMNSNNLTDVGCIVFNSSGSICTA